MGHTMSCGQKQVKTYMCISFLAYECPYSTCLKRFSRSDNLSQHIRIHRQQVPKDAMYKQVPRTADDNTTTTSSQR